MVEATCADTALSLNDIAGRTERHWNVELDHYTDVK
jgi:hypothetical protein